MVLTAVPVDLPQDVSKDVLAFTIDNVFSKEECEEMMKLTEEIGYEPALVNIGGGRQMLMNDVRNNMRCIVDSQERAEEIWKRIKPFVPSTFRGRKALGLNERLRFLRYDPGEMFASHFDGCYQRENGERSYVTVQLYLNEGFRGGETTFLGRGSQFEECHCVPRTGMVLVFQHNLFHQGSAVVEGRKYCVRTDIMYAADEETESNV
eukprot:JP446633.1.p1 GENE.JP446633.1~~JP446633.1.p1  ORF type:complete len:221 (-),score=47.43 JP446633.1:299-919(-)